MLNFDIQVEIIKRLPVKSLIQFRSVCKAWKSLIDSSHFIAGYNNPHHHLMIRYEVGFAKKNEVKYVSFVDDDSFPQQKYALTVPPLLQAKETKIIGSSHGLLCLTDDFRNRCYSSETQMAVLWNPSIRKSIAVAVPNVVHPPFNYVLGFGVCPHTKDPKLVKITYINDIMEMESISSIPCQVMVFTLSSGEWTTSSCTNLPRKSIEFTQSQTVIGQFIYWLAYDRTVVDGGFRFHNMIMSFDMSTQEFREVDLPDSLNKLRKSALSIFRIRESLAVVEYVNFFLKRVCDVWMMEDGDSKVFTRPFTINAPYASLPSILGFRKSGEPIVEMQDEEQDFYTTCTLVVYEPFSEHFKALGIRGNRYSFFGRSYTESLLLLDHEDGQIVKCGAVKRGLLKQATKVLIVALNLLIIYKPLIIYLILWRRE